MMREIALIMILVFFCQSCCPFWIKNRKECEKKYETKEDADIEKYKARLRTVLVKMKPANISTRRAASLHLHSMRRVLNGKIETEYEKNIADQWKKFGLDKKTKDLLVERIRIFASMPSYLQKKIVDDSFLFTPIDKPLRLSKAQLESENAGNVCTNKRTKICQGGQVTGKIQIPEGSQGMVLDPSRPISAVANGKAGLLLINISSPSTPAFFTSNPYNSAFTGFVNDVTLFNRGISTFAIITSNKLDNKPGAFEILDITAPVSPTFISKVEGSYQKLSITENNLWAFSFNERNKTIDIINLSDLYNPTIANRINESGRVTDLAFNGNYLQVLKEDGFSTIYQFAIDVSNIPQLIWNWSADTSPCPGTILDYQGEVLMSNVRSTIVRDGGFKTLDLTPDWPVEAGIDRCTTRRHNSGVYNMNYLIIDSVQDHPMGDCDQWPRIEFYDLPGIGPSNPPVYTAFDVPNEIKGLSISGDKLYAADHHDSKCYKIPDELLHFRIYSLPNALDYYDDLRPTIETVNGQPVRLEDLPDMACGSNQAIFCTSDAACGESGICRGGVCVQMPIFEITSNQELVLTGTNYWDINAKVLFQNVPQSQWHPFDATVLGDEFCDLSDRLSITLDPSVTSTGRKKIKIRNFNSDPKKRVCANCDNPNDPNCTPDYVDSEEVTVYFRNSVTDGKTGYDLTAIEVYAKHGSGGCGDLDESYILCPEGDDEIIMLSSSPFGQAAIVTPDDDGWEISSDHRRKNLSTLLSQVEPTGSDSQTIPMVQLKEQDLTALIGAALVTFGTGCIAATLLTQVCGPYAPACLAVCGTIAVVGLVLVAVSGEDFITSETHDGLVLTKALAEQVLTYGEQCLPQSWKSSESSESKDSVIEVSDLTTIGGIRQRIITKRYKSKNSDANYEIQYLLKERR